MGEMSALSLYCSIDLQCELNDKQKTDRLNYKSIRVVIYML